MMGMTNEPIDKPSLEQIGADNTNFFKFRLFQQTYKTVWETSGEKNVFPRLNGISFIITTPISGGDDDELLCSITSDHSDYFIDMNNDLTIKIYKSAVDSTTWSTSSGNNCSFKIDPGEIHLFPTYNGIIVSAISNSTISATCFDYKNIIGDYSLLLDITFELAEQPNTSQDLDRHNAYSSSKDLSQIRLKLNRNSNDLNNNGDGINAFLPKIKKLKIFLDYDIDNDHNLKRRPWITSSTASSYELSHELTIYDTDYDSDDVDDGDVNIIFKNLNDTSMYIKSSYNVYAPRDGSNEISTLYTDSKYNWEYHLYNVESAVACENNNSNSNQIVTYGTYEEYGISTSIDDQRFNQMHYTIDDASESKIEFYYNTNLNNASNNYTPKHEYVYKSTDQIKFQIEKFMYQDDDEPGLTDNFETATVDSYQFKIKLKYNYRNASNASTTKYETVEDLNIHRIFGDDGQYIDANKDMTEDGVNWTHIDICEEKNITPSDQYTQKLWSVVEFPDDITTAISDCKLVKTDDGTDFNYHGFGQYKFAADFRSRTNYWKTKYITNLLRYPRLQSESDMDDNSTDHDPISAIGDGGDATIEFTKQKMCGRDITYGITLVMDLADMALDNEKLYPKIDDGRKNIKIQYDFTETPGGDYDETDYVLFNNGVNTYTNFTLPSSHKRQDFKIRYQLYNIYTQIQNQKRGYSNDFIDDTLEFDETCRDNVHYQRDLDVNQNVHSEYGRRIKLSNILYEYNDNGVTETKDIYNMMEDIFGTITNIENNVSLSNPGDNGSNIRSIDHNSIEYFNHELDLGDHDVDLKNNKFRCSSESGNQYVVFENKINEGQPQEGITLKIHYKRNDDNNTDEDFDSLIALMWETTDDTYSAPIIVGRGQKGPSGNQSFPISNETYRSWANGRSYSNNIITIHSYLDSALFAIKKTGYIYVIVRLKSYETFKKIQLTTNV